MLASCSNFTGSDVLFIRILTKFDVELCVTLLNFRSNSKSNAHVNAINYMYHVVALQVFFHIRISTRFYVDLCNLFKCYRKSKTYYYIHREKS